MSAEQDKRIQEAAKLLSKQLADKGSIIEGGWVGFKLVCGLQGAPVDQLAEMKKAFFAGASHLFSSIMCFLEPGTEPTDKDMDRITLIYEELQKFQKKLEAEIKGQP